MIEDWKTYTINDCCEILDNLRVPLNSEEREKIQGNIPYYGANGVQGYISKFLFDEELILMAEDGGNFDQFATRPIAYKISGKSWVNNHAHVLKAKNGFNQDFIFYSIVHKNILFFIQGGTRSKLNQSDLKSIKLKFPKSKDEQSLIATILITIDQAIEKTEQLIAKYERIKIGLMQDLLTRGIDEEGNIRSEETHEFKDSVLGKIPKEWKIVKFESIAFPIDAQPDHRTPKESPDGIPYIGINDVDEHGTVGNNCRKVIIEAYLKQKESFTIREGDIIFGKIGTVGFPKRLKEQQVVAISANVILLKPLIDPSFVFWLLESEYVKRQVLNTAHSTSQAAFGMEKIRNLIIALPCEKEFKKIGEIIDKQQECLQMEKQNLAKLKVKKTGLMQDLLTGKVRVDKLTFYNSKTI
ncbi:restriction endonuclease subunit S [Haliscomenobacter sp.]|uniref:restriction endonuclease subunit S n=1 Tax=Haliscomenobacter sp. TaxID=2717303 RepID=UPI003BABC1A5